MDTLSFIAEIVRALAWPAAVVITVCVLRAPLRGLIPLLTRLKYKDLELEFGRKLEEINTQVGLDLPEPATPNEQLPGDTAKDLAALSPRAAVLEAWRRVEIAALKRARALAAEAGEDASKVQLRDAVRNLGKDTSAYPAIFDQVPVLRELRNRAAHAPDFALSSESARNFVAIAKKLESTLAEGPSN